MSTAVQTIQSLRDDIVRRVKGGQAEIAEMKHSMNAFGLTLQELYEQVNQAGEPISSRLGAPSPGQQVTQHSEGLEMFSRTGRYAFEISGGFFPLDRQAITSGDLGYGTPGIIPADRGGFAGPLARTRLVLRDVIPSRPVDSGEFHFTRQLTAATASPQAGEGGAKHETGITWSAIATKIKTITSYVHASRQALEDLQEFRRVIDDELRNAVLTKEQEEMLAGDGLGEHLSGLITEATAFETSRIISGDSKLDFLRHAISQLEEIDETPSFAVLNPADFWSIKGLKDGASNTGSYLLPIGRSDGGTVWLPTVRTTAIAAGQFLVGSSNRAEILDRQMVRVLISFEHDQNFTKNLATILAESRVGLAVYAGSGFVEGSFSGASPL